VQYTETESYLLQQEAEQHWWLAFLLALCVHGAVAAALVFMPSLFTSRPIVEEVVSVSLVAMPEVEGASTAPPAGPAKSAVEKVETPPPPPPPPTPPKPPESIAPPEQLAPTPKERVAVQPETAPPEPIELKNPISLAPEKRKIQKTQDTRLEEEKAKEREKEERELLKKIEERKQEAARKEAQQREEERKKALAQARLEQIKAENEARAAADEARKLAAQANAAKAAADAVRADASRRTQAMQGAVAGGTSGRQQAQSIVEQTYWGTVAQRVRSFWTLPESKWEPNLLAMVVITIKKNGEVTSIRFDQRSTDPLFDQLVEKTIKKASPMPSFPALMQQETTEVGFKFRPGELGNM